MRVHLVEGYHSSAMRVWVEPLLTMPGLEVTEGIVPDSTADLNYYVPWHFLDLANLPKGKNVTFYTHYNPGSEAVLKQKAQASDHIVCMSKQGEAELWNLGVTTPISVIYPPVLDQFIPRKRRIAVVGAEQPNGRKHSSLLLDLAWSMDLSPFHFIIIGTGWEDVVKKLKNLGVTVDYTAEASADQVLETYQTADALLVTAYREGGPLPLVEALACGTPVISPRYGLAAELPNLVKYYTEVKDLQHCMNELVTPILKGREQLKDFTYAAYRSKHIELFNHVLYPDTPKSRYDWVAKLVQETKAKSLLEIGTWTGERALAMIDAAKANHDPKDIYYLGFDLFRKLTDEEIKTEFSKQPMSKEIVEARLAHTGANIYLISGDTRRTLHDFAATYSGGKFDFVFIDGGHSFETIQSDWEAVQLLLRHNGVVLFDDYYTDKHPDRTGCQHLIGRLDLNKWVVELLEPIEAWPQEWGDLHIQMVKVTRKVN